jgi:benzoate-CoA ligase family protein
MNFPTLFDAVFAMGHNERTAMLYEQRAITYAELRSETMRAAEVFRAQDLQPGERVAILLHDSPEFIAAFVGVQSLGAIAVPINMGLSSEEQRLILDNCAARVAVVESEICNKLLTGARERLRNLKDVLVVGRDDRVFAQIEGLTTTVFAEAPRRQLGADFPAGQGGDTPSFILYTSGSTGEPKGAVHSQSHIFYTYETFCKEVLRLRPGDRLFSSSRLPFAYGLGNSFSFPLLNGATTVLCREKPTPEIIGRVFREYRPTIFFGVPVIFNLLLEHNRREALDCSSLRLCVSAGEALPSHIGEEWQRTFGVEVLDGIGSTEMLHMWMSNHEGEISYGSSGRLLQGYEARLLDQNDEPTPPGEVGNLWVKGASAALGYWQRPEATARTFVDGWVRTGDLYRCDGRNYWFHMGRSDDCFKSSGQWVSPVEVEGVLIRHSAVSGVAVVEDFDEDELPCPCAFVVSADAESSETKLEEELRQLAEESLPRFKRPRSYVFVAELPYTATGKVQRFKLREKSRAKRIGSDR